jgi:hypothetical protein
MAPDYQLRYTKTFIERTWWRRIEGATKWAWQRVPQAPELPLDDQIKAFVEETGAVIIHPGQLGIHTQWHDENMTFKQVTIGTTVLYIEAGGSKDGQRVGQGQEAAAGAGGATRGVPGADPSGGGEPGANAVDPADAITTSGPAASNAPATAPGGVAIVSTTERPPAASSNPAAAPGSGSRDPGVASAEPRPVLLHTRPDPLAGEEF